MRAKQSVPLLEDHRRELWHRMIMTLLGEFVRTEPFNVLKVSLVFPLVQAGVLVIQIDHHTILGAQLVQNVLVSIVLVLAAD